MKTFYSILSAVINPVSCERISLGLLLSDGNTSFFNYSRNRLTLISSVIDYDTKRFIKTYLKSIESVIKKIDINEDQTNIFEDFGKNIIVNESYVEYLSNYNKNVINFSKPVLIDVDVNDKIFENLFARFIDDEPPSQKPLKSDVELAKIEFFPKVKNYFTTKKVFSADTTPTLFLPVTIDLFGKNEIPVIGQFFDLDKSINSIKNDFFDYQQIAQLYKKGKKFLVSSEPDKLNQKDQHHFWSVIRKQNSHTYIDISEIEAIREYAKEHNVMPQ